MSRPSKIARLPHPLREQINRRLLDNQPANVILSWLNPMSDVQAILNAEFGGLAITEQNLSNWRRGPFRHWLIRHDAMQLVQTQQVEAGLAQADLAGSMSDKLIRWTALHYAATAQTLLADPADPAANWSRLRELCADVTRLRRSDLAADRVGLEREWLALEKDTQERLSR